MRCVKGRFARFTVTAALTAVLTIAGVGLATPANAAPAQLYTTAQWYNTAQNAFSNGDVGGGLGSLDALLREDPNDADALALQAMWADYSGDLIKKYDSLNRLGPRRGQVEYALGQIMAASLTPPNPFPSIQGGNTAIVVLGYGLLPDGSLRPELVSRLNSAAVQALTAPFSPIIVTGGAPKNGITEAAAMQGYLISRGIPANRIHPEHRAGSTVENAIFSAQLARSLGANSAALVTSANHIRRATADFNIAGLPVIGAMSTLDEIITQLPPVPRANQRGMYIDASRVMGLPAGR